MRDILIREYMLILILLPRIALLSYEHNMKIRLGTRAGVIKA